MTRFHRFKMQKSKKGHNSVNYSQNFWKVKEFIYIMYPNSMPDIMILAQDVSPDILLTRLLYYTKCQTWKREIIQPNINRILPKVNQVIYTLDTICELNIMILAQAVLQIFCWQVSIGLQWKRLKNGRKRGVTLQGQQKRKKNTSPLIFHAHSIY